MRYRSTDYPDDLMGVDPSLPATAPIFRGAAFQQQEINGVTFLNPGDDRVTFVGEIDNPDQYRHYSQQLPADSDGVGQQVSKGGFFPPFQSSPNPNRQANVPARTDPGSAIPQVEGTWYDTLRPHAGYPLNPMSDTQYAFTTGVQQGDPWASRHETLQVAPGVRIVAENPLDYADRLSVQPSTEQSPNRSWDTTLGAQQWDGLKDAQQRPIARTSYDVPALPSRLPSPTGAGGAIGDEYAFDLYPQPLTFRAPPTPWDQGSNADNGFYVDSGY